MILFKKVPGFSGNLFLLKQKALLIYKAVPFVWKAYIIYIILICRLANL